MPITFDTLEELKAFCRTFRLDEKAGSLSKSGGEESAPRRGRKPGSSKRPVGRPPAKYKKGAAKTVKAKVPRVPKEDTLTFKIRETIRKFLDANRSFTANDVYDDLVRRDKTVNKQSVITSVLKQMNSAFKTIKVTERPGNGPRAVKLYNP